MGAWTLRDRPSTEPATTQTISALIKAAGSRTDNELGVVRYGPYSLKSSPILRGSALRDFLLFLLTEAGSYLTNADLFQVMRHRFNLVDLPPAELEDSVPDRRADVSSTVEDRIAARAVVAQLGSDRARLIRAVAEADDDGEQAAQRSGVTVGEVVEALDTLHGLIAEYAESADDAVAVHRYVLESLYDEGETL
jgi:hypothetical protein